MASPGMEEGKGEQKPIFRDIRRYFCDYCGICRSKKSLITSHILTHHKEEVDKEKVEDQEAKGIQSNTCQKCGATFKKPAYLKEHMRSHSLQRPFVCSVDDCHASYRRKDHLSRHILQHQGKLFKCPAENCNCEFAFQGNMTRHVKEHHEEVPASPVSNGAEQYVCKEIGCGKIFKYPSKLRKHEESHVNLDSMEAFCAEPECMKYLTNKQCLDAHIRSCHQHIRCEICGSKRLRKNIKRHLRTHETDEGSVERIKCNFKGCCLSFATKSNLQQHVKAAHQEIKPFACSFPGCGMRFAYKHVRESHEKSGRHAYVAADFVEADEQFRSRPRGGRKRKCPTVDMLIRKRVCPPSPNGASNLVMAD